MVFYSLEADANESVNQNVSIFTHLYYETLHIHNTGV